MFKYHIALFGDGIDKFDNRFIFKNNSAYVDVLYSCFFSAHNSCDIGNFIYLKILYWKRNFYENCGTIEKEIYGLWKQFIFFFFLHYKYIYFPYSESLNAYNRLIH